MRKDLILHFGALAILLFLELLGVFSDYHQGNFARILVLAAYGIGYNVLFGYTGLLSLGHTFQKKALIRVNILTNSIKGLTSQIVEVLCIVFTFFIISFFARYVWRSLTRNFERGTVSPTLTETPIWMVETVFFIGLTIFLFQMLVTALVVILRKPEES